MKRSISPFLAVLAVLLAASIVPERAAGQDRMKLSTIVIDPGHGGHDPGCISADKKTQEKNVALDIAQRLSRKIGESLPGVKTVLSSRLLRHNACCKQDGHNGQDGAYGALHGRVVLN